LILELIEQLTGNLCEAKFSGLFFGQTTNHATQKKRRPLETLRGLVRPTNIYHDCIVGVW
jgi:hypothetical protein